MSEDGQTTNKTVMITGATGFVGSWITRRLLESGCRVQAAVRDARNGEKLHPLRDLADELSGEIRFFEADLCRPGSYAEAMAGCEVVFHTASPFFLQVGDAQQDLIEPALEGTRNVLGEAGRHDTVRRVVVTSSCAAIYGDNADSPRNGDRFTEADWNVTSDATHKAYSYSKTLAETEAWKLAEAQDRWDLVTINPSLVLGPGIYPSPTSGSFELVHQLAGGRLKSGVPEYYFGVVDVREVAEAHHKAGLDPDVPSGRYILSAHDSSLPELVTVLRDKYGDRYPFPRRILPKWAAWLFGPFVDKSVTRRIISRNVGVPSRFDNTRSREILGVCYRPVRESLIDMFEEMRRVERVRFSP